MLLENRVSRQCLIESCQTIPKCLDHVISTGHQMTNLMSNFDYLLVQGVLALCEFHYGKFHYCGFSKLLLKFG